MKIDIKKIFPNPEQPRKDFDLIELESLAESIRQHGLINPISLEGPLDGDIYILIDGERRVRAARIAGLEEIEASVRAPMNGNGPRERLTLALVANLQRAEMNPIEEAEGYQNLRELGYSVDQIAALTGIHKSNVNLKLGFLTLPREIQELFAQHKLPISSQVTAALRSLPVDKQVPMARSLAAYRKLVKDGKAGYERMPVNVLDLTDEEMFRHGIQENLARKNLTPVEEARAMKRFRDEFGKTSVEIGGLFNLAESTVRNKIRLLDLPAHIQATLAEGSLSEGAARELLRFYDLPEEIQKKGGQGYRMPEDNWNQTTPLVKRALNGATAETVRGMIDHLVRSEGNNLHEAVWKWDESLTDGLFIHSATCKICDAKLVLDGKTYCPLVNCYRAKKDLWIGKRLAAASAACGIRAPEDIHKVGDIAVPPEVRSSGCENLRVIYDPYAAKEDDIVPGFKNVHIVCGNRNSICTCANGLAAKRAAEEKSRRMAAAPAEVQTANKTLVEVFVQEKTEGPVKSEDLRAAARDEKRVQREAVKKLDDLQNEFARRMTKALLEMNRLAWFATFNGLHNLPYDYKKAGTLDEILLQKALSLAKATYTNYYVSKIDLEKLFDRMNEALILMGQKRLDEVE